MTEPDRAVLRVSPIWFACILTAYLVHDHLAYSPGIGAGPWFALGLAAVLLVIVAIDAGVGLVVLTVVLVFSDDIPRMGSAESPAALNTLLTTPLGGVAVGNLLALAAFAIAFIVAVLRWGQNPEQGRLRSADVCVGLVVLLYAAATVHGYEALQSNPRGALNDWNLPLMLGAFYVYVRSHANTGATLSRLWSALFLAIGAKAVAWIAFFYLGVGVEFGRSIRVATESGRVLLVFCLVSGFLLQDRRLGLPFSERALALLISGFAALNLLVDASRGPWLMTAFGLTVIVLLGNLGGKIRWVALAGCLLPLLGLGVWYVRPEAYDQIGYYWSTLQFWKEGNVQRSVSTMVRVYEFMNIHALLIDQGNVVLGQGPGSRFSDAYHSFPFGLRTNDYTFAEIRDRSFENPHGLLPNLMLDTGYGGLAAYLSIMAVMYALCFRAYLRAEDAAVRSIAMSVLAFLPAIVYMSWSPKINMFVGIFLGMVGALQCITAPASPPLRGPVRATMRGLRLSDHPAG